MASPTSNKLSKDPQIPSSDLLSQALNALSVSERQQFDKIGGMTSSDITTDIEALQFHGLLERLDPYMAARWHWRDTRKVLRNLQIMHETGQIASEVIVQQDESENSVRSGSCTTNMASRLIVIYTGTQPWSCGRLQAQKCSINA